MTYIKETLFSPLLVNLALEYAITKVWKNQVGLDFNEEHHFPAHADNVILLRDNIYCKQREILIYGSKGVGLELMKIYLIICRRLVAKIKIKIWIRE
jgi:hypothetical protein